MSFSVSAFEADEKKKEGESSLKIEDVSGQKNKVAGDIDEEITNAKLRAESGSKSKWSGSFTANYQGASLEKPLDKDRANPTNLKVPERVKLSGDLGIRYRMDKNQSLSLGTGYSLQRPLQEAKYGDISDPYLSYNYAAKIGKVQSISQVIGAAATNADELEIGQVAAGSLMQTMMYDFNGSKLSVGLALEADYNYFNKGKDVAATLKGHPTATAGDYQTDYVLAAYPLMEYAISDRVQLRTVFRPWIYQHSVTEAGFTFAKSPWTQSFGIGFAATRDIYLYPNFQWAWEDWRGDDFNWFRKQTRANSTVGLAATINMF
jgi:hypothetical protein